MSLTRLRKNASLPGKTLSNHPSAEEISQTDTEQDTFQRNTVREITMQKQNEVYTELFTSARDIISNKAKWCQGDYAHTETGGLACINEDEAVSFCAVGALHQVCFNKQTPVETLIKLMAPLAKKQYLQNRDTHQPLPNKGVPPEEYILHVNDVLGYKETLILYDNVINTLGNKQINL